MSIDLYRGKATRMYKLNVCFSGISENLKASIVLLPQDGKTIRLCKSIRRILAKEIVFLTYRLPGRMVSKSNM